MQKYLDELMLNPKVVKFSVITKLYEASLKELHFHETYIQSPKKVIKEKGQSEIPDGTICST